MSRFAKIGPAATDWLSLGIPAIGNNGDIAFRGTLKILSKRVGAVAFVSAGESIARLIATDDGQLRNLSDPIVAPDGRILFSAQIRAAQLTTQLFVWEGNGFGAGTLTSTSSEILNGIEFPTIRRFERIGAFDGGILSVLQFSRSPNAPLRRGIMFNAGSNTLLQVEEDPLVTGSDIGGKVTHIDFLTPIPGVGGQTRGINASGQYAFLVKLSSGRTLIHVTKP